MVADDVHRERPGDAVEVAGAYDVAAEPGGLPRELCELPCVHETVRALVLWALVSAFGEQLRETCERRSWLGMERVRTWVLKTWTWPSMGWAKTMLAAALPTNQSPATTSMGEPFREYGCIVAAIMGNRENMTSPAPSAPLQSTVHRPSTPMHEQC